MIETSQSIAATRPPQRAVAPEPEDHQGFEERWAAWQAKGRIEERAGRRRLSLAVLLAGIASVVTFFVFL